MSTFIWYVKGVWRQLIHIPIRPGSIMVLSVASRGENPFVVPVRFRIRIEEVKQGWASYCYTSGGPIQFMTLFDLRFLYEPSCEEALDRPASGV